MKRTKKTIEKRTYSMKGAIPTFVSLVDRGANFTPFSAIRYAENEKFGQAVEINKVEFSKSTFATSEKVQDYLISNNFEDFIIEETDELFVVKAHADESFENLSEVEYEDGVKYFIGKLKTQSDEEAPAAEIVEADELQFSEEQSTEIVVEEVSEPEIVTNSEEESNEENNTESQEPTSEEGSSEFSEEVAEPEKEEVIDETFSDEQFIERFSDKFVSIEKFNEIVSQLEELKEKLIQFEEKTKETIDENVIVIQNSQSIQTDEIVSTIEENTDDESAKFSQKRRADLFGLRG